jgi:hypothetical protein
MWLAKMRRSKRVLGLIAIGGATLGLATPADAHRRGGGVFFGFSAGPGYPYYRPPPAYYAPRYYPPPVYYVPPPVYYGPPPTYYYAPPPTYYVPPPPPVYYSPAWRSW